MSEEGIKIICYTDGSAQPNPGPAGYGVYGYMMKPAKAPRNVNYAAKTNIKYTTLGLMTTKEASANSKVDKEKYEVTHMIEHIGSINDANATNNQGEMKGLLTALKFASVTEGVTEILVISDSKYALDGFTKGIPIWSKNDWKTKAGTDVKNKNIWLELKEVGEELKSKGIKISTQWVKGHEDDVGNIVADMFALIGTNFSRNQMEEGDLFITSCYSEITPISEFKKELLDRHPMFDYNSLLFNTADNNLDRVMLVSTFNPFSEQDMGKRNIFATYGLMYKGLPNIYSRLRENFNKLERPFHTTAMVNLDTLKKDKLLTRIIGKIGFKPIIVKHKTNNGWRFMAFNKDGVIVEDIGKEYTHMLETYKTFEALDLAMMKFEHGLTTGRTIDITDLVLTYEDPEKPTLTLTYRDRYFDLSDKITLPDYEIVSKLKLIVGMDTPPQSFLSDIKNSIDKVYLYCDVESNPNLMTMSFIVKYKDIHDEDCYIVTTNLLNKYVVRKNLKEAVEA